MIEAGANDQDWYSETDSVHIPQNVFIFDDEETLVLDTFSPASTEKVLRDIETVLDGRSLDYLVVSHPDVPHAGNTMAILEKYPEAELVAPAYGKGHELYHLEDARRVAEGDTIDLGEHTVEFHEATFLDAAVSLWMSDQLTDTLFPIDWLGFPHLGSEELAFVDELETEITPDRLEEFHGRVFFWFQYVDVEKINREIEHLIQKFQPEILAPAHGLVIREEPERYMKMVQPVIESINADGRVGTLG
ncbi:MBL fold metallo-hydrolase [Natrinema sp. 1APR25-10V2]|uniref:MBL fold metallo-hydrolase n=1 Tax=Natrinema sp. 1APR25-10V2 TaxID=2951081 RepID=UPI0028762403|nr:MBL fold metallo-hydrolase [Natrinema sp. 1APR25-10V2]MDS0476932.1 MBL fold metallo-hydrolase [Natrinema sp. 1APR25-10V2]